MVRKMRSTGSIRNRSRFVAALKAVFLAVTLLAALILGCLAINAIDINRDAPVNSTSVATAVSQTDVVSTGSSALYASSATDVMSCANCAPSGAHFGLTVACVLALLALFVGLLLPGRHRLHLLRIVRVHPVLRAITNFRPSTPSLDVLCISRT